MRRDLRIERVFPYDRALLWRTLTDPVLLATWLMKNDFRPEVGHAFTMHTDPAPGFDGVVRCTVLELVPEQRMRWSWAGGGIETELTFVLEDAILHGRSATKLVLLHRGFEGMQAMLTSFILGAGWARMLRTTLRAILDALAQGSPVPTRTEGAPKEKLALWRIIAKLVAPLRR